MAAAVTRLCCRGFRHPTEGKTILKVKSCLYYGRVGTENRTSLDNPVILAVESFKVTSYKFRFSDETMFILPSYDFY